jgi:preprotein translocase subunit YajC
MLTEIKKGDEIVTTGGLFGTVTRVKDDRFVVEIAENTRIELGKGFVSSKIEATIVD